jgi:hypothetical protein
MSVVFSSEIAKFAHLGQTIYQTLRSLLSSLAGNCDRTTPKLIIIENQTLIESANFYHHELTMSVYWR